MATRMGEMVTFVRNVAMSSVGTFEMNGNGAATMVRTIVSMAKSCISWALISVLMTTLAATELVVHRVRMSLV